MVQQALEQDATGRIAGTQKKDIDGMRGSHKET
jgi:hypothetical protein